MDPLNLRDTLQLAESAKDITDLFYHDEESIFYAALDKLKVDLQETKDALPTLFINESVSELKSSIVPDLLKDLEQARVELKVAEDPLLDSLKSLTAATQALKGIQVGLYTNKIGNLAANIIEF